MELEKWIINHREIIGIVLLILLLIFLCCHLYLNRSVKSEDKLESFRTGGSSTCGNNN
tara:strand:+ start:232 stop:405 length:174 start_codon:yes stop_codon:yes gene_type:complete